MSDRFPNAPKGVLVRRGLVFAALVTIGLLAAGCPGGGTRLPTTRRPGRPVPEPRPAPAPTPPVVTPRAPPAAHVAPSVLVRLSRPDRAGSARVRVSGAYELRTAAGAVVARGTKVDATARLGSSGSIAGQTAPASGLELVPSTPGDLRVDDRRYPGALRIERDGKGRFGLVVATDLETYLEGVVPGEIPATFPTEAQRTQAIVARTYALSRAPRTGAIRLHDHGGADQEYVGIPAVAAHRQVARDAVSSTRGMVLLDGALPLRTYYHSTCGGATTPVESVFPDTPTVPLSGVSCSWCTASKYYRWHASLPAADVLRAAGATGPLRSLTVLARDGFGRATRIRVVGATSQDVPAGEFRLRVGAGRLRSTWFDDLAVDGGAVAASGRGWGHGVGLCQMGAKGLAETGSAAAEIVATYYPGAQLVRMW